MIDIVLVAILLTVSGVFVWTERSRFVAPDGGDGEQTVTGAPRRGYFWRLARPAGLSPESAWPFFLAAKILLPVAFLFVAAFALDFGPVLTLLAVALGFILPDAVLGYVRKERQANIRRGMSFFLDLIVSFLQAGLSLDEAFKRAAREGLARDHPLSEEALLVSEELDIGRDRSTAFHALADRTGVRELRGLANALGVGLGSGASVEATLRAQADLARAKRREDGLRRLNIASAEVLLPLMLCGFPVFAVIVFFPLALMVLSSLQSLAGALR